MRTSERVILQGRSTSHRDIAKGFQRELSNGFIREVAKGLNPVY